jgi:hypothetical protein
MTGLWSIETMVQGLVAEKAETPTAANNLRKRLIRLKDFAIALDWRGDNPAQSQDTQHLLLRSATPRPLAAKAWLVPRLRN